MDGPITDPRRLLGPKPKRTKPNPPHGHHDRPTQAILDERRQHTLRTFLFSNLSQSGIAAAVSAIMTAAHKNDPQPQAFHFDRYDIVRDLDWWKKTNREKYAIGRTLDAGEIIGHALDFADQLQHEAMQIYTNASARTGADREPIHRLDRLLRTAWMIQRERLNLMFNLGLISRTTASDVAARVGNMLDYEKVMERAKARRDITPIAPGTSKWLGQLPTDGREH